MRLHGRRAGKRKQANRQTDAAHPAHPAVQGLTNIDIPAAVQRKTELYVDLAGGLEISRRQAAGGSCCVAAGVLLPLSVLLAWNLARQQLLSRLLPAAGLLPAGLQPCLLPHLPVSPAHILPCTCAPHQAVACSPAIPLHTPACLQATPRWWSA